MRELWGSMSTRRVLYPRRASPAPTLTQQVVLATPPLMWENTITWRRFGVGGIELVPSGWHHGVPKMVGGASTPKCCEGCESPGTFYPTPCRRLFRLPLCASHEMRLLPETLQCQGQCDRVLLFAASIACIGTYGRAERSDRNLPGDVRGPALQHTRCVTSHISRIRLPHRVFPCRDSAVFAGSRTADSWSRRNISAYFASAPGELS